MTAKTLRLKADEAGAGQRLDVFISERTQLSRTAAQALEITASDGKRLPKNYKVRQGDEFILTLPEPELIEAVPQDIAVDIIYEDEELLVVNKPQGMVVHPACGNPDNTLVNALLFKCQGRLSSINGKIRPGIVHRLDKDTAGLLIVAKNDNAHHLLAEQIAAHSFTRKYLAIVTGRIKDDSGTITVPIGRSKSDRKKRAVGNAAVELKPAVTHYKVKKRYKNYTFVELTLETGRTHQIRVHMKYINHPVLGDPVYGAKANAFNLNGQCLVAYYIKFQHPTLNKELEFTAPLPDFLTQALEKLDKTTGEIYE